MQVTSNEGPLRPQPTAAEVAETEARPAPAIGEPILENWDGEPPLVAPDDVGGECPEEPFRAPRLTAGPKKHRALAKPEEAAAKVIPAEQKLLLLDTWKRSGLPAGDFGAMVGVSAYTLYGWKKRFDEEGPAGLLNRPRGGPKGSRLSELTKRAILMMKEANPDWGCERISAMLLRGPALPASPGAVARVLHDANYQVKEEPTEPHPDRVRRFERAKPNELWQTDFFTFILKRQNQRVHLVAFLDDHSRFMVSYGLYASPSTALTLETLRAGIASYGTPKEILTDNGSQYVTWRGKSQFARELEKRGIQQVVARPRHPETLGKIERFWGTLWREILETAVFTDLVDARRRIGHFIDYYNFQRPHQAHEGLVPADRFFGAAPEVLKTLKARVAGNALTLAKEGTPRKPFYLTGQVGDKAVSIHAEGERLVLIREDGARQEMDWESPEAKQWCESQKAAEVPAPVCPEGSIPVDYLEGPEAEPPAPGTSPIDRLSPPRQEGGEA